VNELSVESWTWEDWEEDDGPNRNTLTAIVPFQNEFGRRLWGRRSPNGQPVPLIGCSECGNETPEDVKALLATAPDLLALAKDVAAFAESECEGGFVEWNDYVMATTLRQKARAAIAKVEGRE